jgi:hypothetical protein
MIAKPVRTGPGARAARALGAGIRPTGPAGGA